MCSSAPTATDSQTSTDTTTESSSTMLTPPPETPIPPKIISGSLIIYPEITYSSSHK
ncbi:hypothetical protein BOKEGFJH_00830 [Chlamydia avium]|uniref:Uncharacterized protein n=2 Tax=Chlamydia avium TaxID=1457141 RepID=W8JHT3_9CHLA|nr:hypothetical protein M832_08560 [Chlamydia avium 10DC88]EPP38647.1 hypothetical protein CP10881SC42_0285 [Chlamydia avium]VVT43287.1 hypothetical protein BOKEGFJH_00830 [Chlamydia avium]